MSRAGRAIGRAAIALSLAMTLSIVLATDVTILMLAGDSPAGVLIALPVMNLGSVLLALVGGIIEWRRPGHRIGRLLLLGGPLYAALAAGWTTAELVEPYVDRDLYLALNWAGLLLSYPGVALIVGWLPLLFPSGTLPGPRWRLPAAVLVVLPSIGTLAWAVRPGPLVEGVDADNPFGVAGWPTWLQPFIDLIPLALPALLLLAAAGLVVRYRRGRSVERLQIRWFLASTALALIGFAGVLVEQAIRADDGILVSVVVAYAGILAMPVAIGIAVLRYRLFEIDRIISRTIGWAIVTGILLAVFVGLVVGLQGILGGVTQGSTLAVAASTLVAFALFQPVRRRVQQGVDRRFDRARYSGERLAQAFGGQLRDEVDLAAIARSLVTTTHQAVRPAGAAVWLRNGSPTGTTEVS
jgi:hypothetical protein